MPGWLYMEGGCWKDSGYQNAKFLAAGCQCMELPGMASGEFLDIPNIPYSLEDNPPVVSSFFHLSSHQQDGWFTVLNLPVIALSIHLTSVFCCPVLLVTAFPWLPAECLTLSLPSNALLTKLMHCWSGGSDHLSALGFLSAFYLAFSGWGYFQLLVWSFLLYQDVLPCSLQILLHSFRSWFLYNL